MDIKDLLTANLGEFTVGWLLASAVLGGGLGAVIRYVFEIHLPESHRTRQQSLTQVRKYTYPLLQAADEVEHRLNRILTQGIGSDWLSSSVIRGLRKHKGFLADPARGAGYFFLSTLYVFARYFAWVEILHREAGFLEFSRSKRLRAFNACLTRIGNAFRSTELWPPGERLTKDFSKLHRHLQSALGESMIVERDNQLTCISFREFVLKYTDPKNGQFRFWFTNLEKYFDDLCGIDFRNIDRFIMESGDGRVVRLILLQYAFYKLVEFIDPKFERVQKRTNREEVILRRLPPAYRSAVGRLLPEAEAPHRLLRRRPFA